MLGRRPHLIWLTLVACGGDPGSPTTEPPAPPPQAVALVVQAGGEQAAEPRTATSVRPAVVARAANGAPVASVAVTFAVDSGGGTVTEATVTTGADGVAAVGSWVLGPNEGRHVLVATAGSLPPVRFVATAAVPARAVAEADFASGTLSISAGPLAGTRLEVPANAFPSPARWSIEQRSPQGWPARRGVHPIGAMVVIRRSAAGRARAPMRLTLPARVPAGTRPVVVMRDSASGAIDVLPLVDADSTSVTAVAFHFDASAIRSGPSVTSARATVAARTTNTGYAAQVVVSAVPVAELDKDQFSNFVPGRDDWEFLPLPQAVEDPAAGSAMPAGLVLSSLARMTVPGLAPLHGLHRQVAGVPNSNRVGFRAGADLGQALPDQLVASVLALRLTTRATIADQLAHDWLKAALYITGLPQLAFAAVGNQGWVPLVAYRAAGGHVALANPWQPGDSTFSVPFSNGQFAPFSVVTFVTNRTPVSTPAQWLSIASTMQLVNVPDITAALADWEAGRYPAGYVRPVLGQDQLDQSVRVRARGGFVEDTVIYATQDTTQLWVECGACLLPLLTSPLAAKGVAPFAALVAGSTPLANIGSTAPSGALLADTTSRDDRVGFLVSESDGSYARWLDFRWLRLKRWRLAPHAPASWDYNSAADWHVTLSGPTLPPHRVRWTFGEGATPLVQTSGSLTVRVTLTPAQSVGDSIPVRVEVLRAADDSVLAVRKARFPAPRPMQWRLTSFAQVGTCCWFNEIGDMRQNPGAWVLFAFPTATSGTGPWPTPGVYLQRNPATGGSVAWQAGALTQPMAHTVNTPGTTIEGAFSWTGSASSGTITGKATYLEASPCLNRYLFTITATKSPGGISGTITGYVRSWKQLPCAGPPDQSPVLFTAHFTGVPVP